MPVAIRFKGTNALMNGPPLCSPLWEGQEITSSTADTGIQTLGRCGEDIASVHGRMVEANTQTRVKQLWSHNAVDMVESRGQLEGPTCLTADIDLIVN